MLLGTLTTNSIVLGSKSRKATVFDLCVFVFIDVRWLEALVLNWINIREFCLSDAPNRLLHIDEPKL